MPVQRERWVAVAKRAAIKADSDLRSNGLFRSTVRIHIRHFLVHTRRARLRRIVINPEVMPVI